MDKITETPEQRVARGAALLDERVPGWRANINTDRLNMTDGSRCVLGQLAPMITGKQWDGYGDATVALGMDGWGWDDGEAHHGRQRQEAHGFLTLLEGSDEGFGPFMDHDATAALAPLWIEEINKGA